MCRDQTSRDPDTSDNRNSVVSLLTFGPFRFFDGGDLCPQDRVGGPVDLLLRTLRPAVVNNGPRKGGEAGSLGALRSLTALPAVYQVHRSLRAPDGNTAAARIANEEEDCAGHFIKLSVEPRGRAYTVWVPSTGHRQTYATRVR